MLFFFAACCQILIRCHHFRSRGNYQVDLSGILRLSPLLFCREYRLPCLCKKVKASQAWAPSFMPGVNTISYNKLYARTFRDWEMKDIYHMLLKRGKQRVPQIWQRLAEVPLLHWETWLGCIWSYITRWSGVLRVFSAYFLVIHGGFGHSQPQITRHRSCSSCFTNCTDFELQIGHTARKS